LRKRVLIALIILIAIGAIFFVYFCYKKGKVQTKDFISLVWFIPLTAVALLQEEIKKFLSEPPELRIEFDLSAPYCVKTEMRNPALPSINWGAYYFRFRVRNVGKIQAKLCECVAEKLWIFDGVDWQEDRTFQGVNLNWSNSKSKDEFLNINPNCPGWFCDLIHLENLNNTGMLIDYKMPYPNSQYNEIIPLTKHKILISVYSENAKPILKIFEIEWTGEWREDAQEMFREVKLISSG